MDSDEAICTAPLPNPLGDPPALLVRQHKFDKCWSVPFLPVLTEIKKIRTAKYRISNVECRTAEVGTALRDSSFVIRYSAVQKAAGI
jgi:hypothetical protein